MRKFWNMIPEDHRWVIKTLTKWIAIVAATVLATVGFLWLVGPAGILILVAVPAVAMIYHQMLLEKRGHR